MLIVRFSDGGTMEMTAEEYENAKKEAALLIIAGRFAEYLIGAGYGTGVKTWFDPEGEWSMIAWENPEAICRFPFAVKNYYGAWRFSINLWEGLAAVVFLVILLVMKKRKTMMIWTMKKVWMKKVDS